MNNTMGFLNQQEVKIHIASHLRLYVILNLPILSGPYRDRSKGFFQLAEKILDGGATMLQLRAKPFSRRKLFETAVELGHLTRAKKIPLIINDHLDIAIAAGAQGVHLGPEDLPVYAAKKLFPEGIVGASCGTVEKAKTNILEGADYLGVGAIYEARSTKPDASPPRGLSAITTIRQHTNCPIVGIGGITSENAANVIGAGADGVAVISEICYADDPEQATHKLLLSALP